MREIKLLQKLKHDRIVQLQEIMVAKGSVYMVLEYMDHDLSGILGHPNFNFEPAHAKSLTKQMLEGLAYLHHMGILHRDIKGSFIFKEIMLYHYFNRFALCPLPFRIQLIDQ